MDHLVFDETLQHPGNPQAICMQRVAYIRYRDSPALPKHGCLQRCACPVLVSLLSSCSPLISSCMSAHHFSPPGPPLELAATFDCSTTFALLLHVPAAAILLDLYAVMCRHFCIASFTDEQRLGL